MVLKRLHNAGEVHQRPAEAVHFVDHHAVDTPGFNVPQQAFERRPLDAAPGVPAIVVFLGQRDPALGLLAGDECFGAFTLGV